MTYHLSVSGHAHGATPDEIKANEDKIQASFDRFVGRLQDIEGSGLSHATMTGHERHHVAFPKPEVPHAPSKADKPDTSSIP